MGFTCNTCNYSTTDAVKLRKHYTLDWHRYNLRRKTEDLPPVLEKNFQQRVNEQKQAETVSNIKKTYKCPYTGKTFKSEGAWNNYLKSKKYKEFVAKNAERKFEVKTDDNKEQDTNNEMVDAEKKTDISLWKKGDSPQKRWLYLQYIRAGNEDEDNWSDYESEEEDNEEDEMKSTSISKTQVFEDPDLMEEEDPADYDDFLDPEEEFGPAPIELKPIPPLTDFFDASNRKKFETTEELLIFMEKKYNFFLPDKKYIIDVEKLLAYICEKIGVGCTCIFSNKGFYSLRAVQQHMRDTNGHRLNISGDCAFEYADFYDFDQPGANIDEETGKEILNVEELLVEDMQLVLPNGVKLGHKDMAKYYKQKFDFIPSGMECSEYALNRQKMLKDTGRIKTNGRLNNQLAIFAGAQRRLAINTLLTKHRALAVHQMSQAIKNSTRDVRKVNMVYKKQMMQLGIKHNKVKQTHFKKQMMNCG